MVARRHCNVPSPRKVKNYLGAGKKLLSSSFIIHPSIYWDFVHGLLRTRNTQWSRCKFISIRMQKARQELEIGSRRFLPRDPEVVYSDIGSYSPDLTASASGIARQQVCVPLCYLLSRSISRQQIVNTECHTCSIPQPLPPNPHCCPKPGIQSCQNPCCAVVTPGVQICQRLRRLEVEQL